MKKEKLGFTLVELSIVLVIIGLLVGGILAGQSMLHTVKIQKLVRDLQQYEIAFNNFKTTYKYYPGDSPMFTPPGNGDDILWRGAAGNSACSTSPSTIYDNFEAYNTFAHLSQAGMIKTNYVPFTPNYCGGTMTGNRTDYPGVILPYTVLDAKATAFEAVGGIIVTGKFIITPVSTNFPFAGPVYFDLFLSASDVIPLEKKLGSVITNPTPSTGMCYTYTPTFSFVSCNSSTAQLGNLRYNVNPI